MHSLNKIGTLTDMNKIIVLFIKGVKYNPMLKWDSEDDFKLALHTGVGLPKPDDIVVEAYINDNLVDLGNTFETTLAKLKLILNID